MHDSEKISRIKDILMSDAAPMEQALRRLWSFRPETTHYVAIGMKANDGYYTEGDEKAPFFSETFLYSLLGKDDARTLLGRLREVSEAAGFDRHKFNCCQDDED